MLVSHGGTPTSWLHTGLCGFFQNISSNIRSLEKRTDLKLREVSALSISLASQLSPLNGFQLFLLRDSASQELKTRNARLGLISGGEGNYNRMYLLLEGNI